MTTDPKAIGFAVGAVLVMTGIACAVVLNDSPANSAARNAATPSAQPGPPVRQLPSKPVEKSPPVDQVVPGDGTYLVGKEIKRGTYTTQGGSSCYWARLIPTAAGWGIVSSAFVSGPQEVALGKDDVAFATQGCGQWVMAR